MGPVVKCCFCPEPSVISETNWNMEVKTYCRSCYAKMCDPPPVIGYTSAFRTSPDSLRKHTGNIAEWNGADDNIARIYEDCHE